MVLSRIWSAFIIIAIAVALVRLAGTAHKTIFTSMVTGKSGDTIKLNRADTTTLTAMQLHTLDSAKSLMVGKRSVVRSEG